MARALITGISGVHRLTHGRGTAAAGVGGDRRGQDVPGQRSQGGGEPVRPDWAGRGSTRGRGPESRRRDPQGLQVGVDQHDGARTGRVQYPRCRTGQGEFLAALGRGGHSNPGRRTGAPGMPGSQWPAPSWRSGRQPLSSFQAAVVRRRLRDIQHQPGAGLCGQHGHAPGSGPPGRQASRLCRILRAAGGPRTWR